MPDPSGSGILVTLVTTALEVGMANTRTTTARRGTHRWLAPVIVAGLHVALLPHHTTTTGVDR